MKYIVEIDERKMELEIEKTDEDKFKIKIGEKEVKVELVNKEKSRSSLEYTLLLNNKFIKLQISGKKGNYKIHYLGGEYQVEIEPASLRTLKGYTQRKKRRTKKRRRTIVSEITGRVTEVNVEENQKVKKGNCLLVIEAMKAENEILSPYSGIVQRINVAEGEKVEKGHWLCKISPKKK